MGGERGAERRTTRGVRFVPLIEMPCMVSGIWRRFGVHVFEGKVTLEDMARIEQASEAWHAKIPGKLVELVVVIPSGAKMTSDERKKMAHIIRRWENTRTASATVILAQGLVGAMHRSVLTGMQMLAPAPHPQSVFGNVPDALLWLCPHVRDACQAAVEPEDLVAGVDALTESFAARPEKAPLV